MLHLAKWTVCLLRRQHQQSRQLVRPRHIHRHPGLRRRHPGLRRQSSSSRSWPLPGPRFISLSSAAVASMELGCNKASRRLGRGWLSPESPSIFSATATSAPSAEAEPTKLSSLLLLVLISIDRFIDVVQTEELVVWKKASSLTLVAFSKVELPSCYRFYRSESLGI